MLLIAAVMVPVPSFQPLWDSGCPNTGEWCIPHRFRDDLTIRWGLRYLIGDGINLATPACHLQFCLSLHMEALMPQQNCGGCYSQVYDSYTRNGVEIGGVVAKKLETFYHIPSKIHKFYLDKNHIHAVNAVSLINCKILTLNDLQQYAF